MRSDLDRFMAERNIDAFIIPGVEGTNIYRDYLTGGVHASATVIKKRGSDPILIVSGMEADEAAKSGYKVYTQTDLGYIDIVKKYGSGTEEAQVEIWKRYLSEGGVEGRVTFYGVMDMQSSMRFFDLFNKHFADQIEIVKDKRPDIFDLAFETKDQDELEKLRDVGKRTSEVMRATRDWLSTHQEENGQIVNADGDPLTIGAVKQYVRLRLLERDLEDHEGMIFAQGRDAGMPHSRGEQNEVLRVGESIVFDLFPRPVGGGYHHDVTRTWSLGHAKEEVQRDFDLVLNVFHRSLEGIEIGQPTKSVDVEVCKLFESAGHPTRYNTSGTSEGYVHSLGHGLGLLVHEKPSVSILASDKMVFKGGNVVTIEPGLYYPSKGYGIRIEDTIYVDDNGELHNFTDCPYDLVIPLNG